MRSTASLPARKESNNPTRRPGSILLPDAVQLPVTYFKAEGSARTLPTVARSIMVAKKQRRKKQKAGSRVAPNWGILSGC